MLLFSVVLLELEKVPNKVRTYLMCASIRNPFRLVYYLIQPPLCGRDCRLKDHLVRSGLPLCLFWSLRFAEGGRPVSTTVLPHFDSSVHLYRHEPVLKSEVT